MSCWIWDAIPELSTSLAAEIKTMPLYLPSCYLVFFHCKGCIQKYTDEHSNKSSPTQQVGKDPWVLSCNFRENITPVHSLRNNLLSKRVQHTTPHSHCYRKSPIHLRTLMSLLFCSVLLFWVKRNSRPRDALFLRNKVIHMDST